MKKGSDHCPVTLTLKKEWGTCHKEEILGGLLEDNIDSGQTGGESDKKSNNEDDDILCKRQKTKWIFNIKAFKWII